MKKDDNSINVTISKDNINKGSEYNTMEYDTPPVSDSLARILDEAIAQADRPDAKRHTLDEIWDRFISKHKIKNV